MPVGTKHLFPFENIETISDDELKRIGMFDPNSSLYDVPEELLHLKHQYTLKSKLDTSSTILDQTIGSYESNFKGEGSNCWAIHGSKTRSGEPLLACDPHLNKSVISLWYVARLTWKSKGKKEFVVCA